MYVPLSNSEVIKRLKLSEWCKLSSPFVKWDDKNYINSDQDYLRWHNNSTNETLNETLQQGAQFTGLLLTIHWQGFEFIGLSSCGVIGRNSFSEKAKRKSSHCLCCQKEWRLQEEKEGRTNPRIKTLKTVKRRRGKKTKEKESELNFSSRKEF